MLDRQHRDEAEEAVGLRRKLELHVAQDFRGLAGGHDEILEPVGALGFPPQSPGLRIGAQVLTADFA